MAAKKKSSNHEPVLNTVARSLGHAAGTLTRVTQDLSESFSELQASVTTKVRKAAGTPAKRSRIRTVRSKKKTLRATPKKTARSITVRSRRQSATGRKSSRRGSSRA